MPKARPSPDNRRGLVEPAHAFVTGDNTKHLKAFRVIDPDNDILRAAMSFGDAPCVIMLCDMRENGRSLAPKACSQKIFRNSPRRSGFPKTSGVASSAADADGGIAVVDRVRHMSYPFYRRLLQR